MLNFQSKNLEETSRIASSLADAVYSDANIFFFGEMGSGKTQFIKSFLIAKGVPEAVISSPTYTLSQMYQHRDESFLHCDLYRVDHADDLGLEEAFFDKDTITLIEWSERFQDFPIPRIEVRLKKLSEEKREISIAFIGYSLPETELQNLMREYKIPLHIQKHTAAVTAVAVKIADFLIQQERVVDRELLRQAGLLHDLVRYVDFKGGLQKHQFEYSYDDTTWEFWESMAKKYQGRHHADVVYDILTGMGYETMGRVILAHRSNTLFKGFANIHEKILHYADKRCKHDRIVSLEERLIDLKNRYQDYFHDTEYWGAFSQKVYELEKDLGVETLNFEGTPQYEQEHRQKEQ